LKTPVSVGEGIYLVDLNTFHIPRIGAGYIIVDDKITVVETGPTTSAPYLLAGLNSLGIKPGEVDYIALSHIHLDHSGGVGYLLSVMPRAKVLVSEKGVKHLIDPTKLYNSAKLIYKDEMESLFGNILTVPFKRIISMTDGTSIQIGDDRKLTAYYTPGHAPHHLIFHDEKTNGLFCGEVLGLYFPGIDVISPSTAPPSFNFKDLKGSIKKIREIMPEILYFSHYGYCRAIEKCCNENIEKIETWIKMIKNGLEQGQSKEEITSHVTENNLEELFKLKETVDEDDKKYLETVIEFMEYRMKKTCIPGVFKYIEKHS